MSNHREHIFSGTTVLVKMHNDKGCPTCGALWLPPAPGSEMFGIATRELHCSAACAYRRKVNSIYGWDD